jgi:hypothetical protein
MITSSVLEEQVPLEMVQRNVFAPTPSPVTMEVALDAEVIVPVPLTRLHAPVPEAATFPAIVAEDVVHTLWSGPALAVVGTEKPVMITSSVLGVHPPLEMVQRKVFAPPPSPVTAEVALVEVVIVPVPLTRLHTPVPVVGTFPVSVADVPHIF